MSSDIFSLAITMYEIFNWKEAYPKSEFKFSWNIDEFIVNSNRFKKKTDKLTDFQFNLIEQCSCQNIKERLFVEDVIDCLEIQTILHK